MKRLAVAVVILAVIVVMALRGCPRVRRSAGIAHDPATAVPLYKRALFIFP